MKMLLLALSVSLLVGLSRASFATPSLFSAFYDPDTQARDANYIDPDVDLSELPPAHAAGLVVNLKLNESTGATTFFDSSGNANKGTCTSCPTAGVLSDSTHAVLYTATANAILLSSAPATSNVGSVTMGLWVNPSSYVNGGAADGSGTFYLDRTNANNGLMSLKAVNNAWCYQKRDDAGNGLGCITGPNIVLNAWSYVTIVRNFGVSFNIYVNGQLSPVTADSGTTLTLDPTIIGNHQAFGGGAAGLLRDFTVFNRALSHEEHRYEYARGLRELHQRFLIYRAPNE